MVPYPLQGSRSPEPLVLWAREPGETNERTMLVLDGHDGAVTKPESGSVDEDCGYGFSEFGN